MLNAYFNLKGHSNRPGKVVSVGSRYEIKFLRQETANPEALAPRRGVGLDLFNSGGDFPVRSGVFHSGDAEQKQARRVGGRPGVTPRRRKRAHRASALGCQRAAKGPWRPAQLGAEGPVCRARHGRAQRGRWRAAAEERSRHQPASAERPLSTDPVPGHWRRSRTRRHALDRAISHEPSRGGSPGGGGAGVVLTLSCAARQA